MCNDEDIESANLVGDFDRLLLAPPLTLRFMMAQGRERGPNLKQRPRSTLHPLLQPHTQHVSFFILSLISIVTHY